MDFQKFLEKVAGDLDKEVGRILESQLKKAEKTDKKLVPLLKAFAKSCTGGKRIRGSLVALGYQLGLSFWSAPTRRLWRTSTKSGRRRGEQATKERVQNPDSGVPFDSAPPQNDILRVAAAYEIFHTAILVHDDIIDQSPLRRGKPSLYQALGGKHYGISQAVSLADFGFFLSFKIISEADFSEDVKIKALGLFSQVMMDTTWGEMLDLEKTDPRVVMKLKTARYSVAGPLQLGAVLAGAGGGKLLGKLGRLGENLGIAFQIQDDILDAEVDYLGGVEYAKKEAEKYKNKAVKTIPEITKDLKMSKLLEQMGEYLVGRKK